MAPKLLLALDGSEHAQKALDLAITMAKSTGGELLILNVVTDQPLSRAEQNLAETEYWAEIGSTEAASEPAPEAPERRASLGGLLRTSREVGATVRRIIGRELVQRAAAEARARGAPRVTTAIEEGDPATVIIHQATATGASLVLVGSRGLGNIAGLLLGSVSHKVANAAPCSVLIVR